MFYSISQVAKKFNLTAYTLRYYDKLGLLPTVGKSSSGLRRFSENDLNCVAMIECLKETGLTLKEIRDYFALAIKGDETIDARMQMMINQKKRVEEEIKSLRRNLKKIEFKIKYYQTAKAVGETNVYTEYPQMLAEHDKLFK